MTDDLDQRLSRISTMWTLVRHAHAGTPGTEDKYRTQLLERYHGAAYRYLFGAVRNADLADDLFQEFALRVVRGSFRSADPDRGRFRDFVKRSLINLVIDYRKGEWRRPGEMASHVPEPSWHDGDEGSQHQLFLDSWREELLARAWQGLAKREQADSQPFYSVLRFRADYPDVRSAEMAAQLTDQLKPPKPYSEVGIRKLLQRARELFADSLLDEVAGSLRDHSLDHIEEELIDLELLPYCRNALDRRRATAQ